MRLHFGCPWRAFWMPFACILTALRVLFGCPARAFLFRMRSGSGHGDARAIFCVRCTYFDHKVEIPILDQLSLFVTCASHVLQSWRRIDAPTQLTLRLMHAYLSFCVRLHVNIHLRMRSSLCWNVYFRLILLHHWNVYVHMLVWACVYACLYPCDCALHFLRVDSAHEVAIPTHAQSCMRFIPDRWPDRNLLTGWAFFVKRRHSGVVIPRGGEKGKFFGESLCGGHYNSLVL